MRAPAGPHGHDTGAVHAPQYIIQPMEQERRQPIRMRCLDRAIYGSDRINKRRAI